MNRVSKGIAVVEDVRRGLLALAEAARPVMEQFRNAMQEAMPVLLEIAKGLQSFPDRTRDALLRLGSHGWYLDPDLPASAIFELADSLANKPAHEADQVLCNWIDGHLEEAEKLLSQKFPEREQLFHEAFVAHKKRMYAASIPLLLAQADGICKQLHGIQLFKKLRSGKLLLKEEAESIELSDIEQAMLAPLLEPLPIVANEKERALLSNHLNRHAILHGESIDYATRDNSCRAISLLTYASWALSEMLPNNAIQPTPKPLRGSGSADG